MKRLKNRPLSLQIWIVFAAVIVIIFALLSLYFSITIKSFFNDEIYRTIETAQENAVKKAEGTSDSQEEDTTGAISNDIREVRNIRLNRSYNNTDLTKIEKFITDKTQADLFLKKLKSQVKKQSAATQRYTQKIGSARLLYVVRINGKNKKSNFMVSYMWDTYRNSLAANMMKRIFSVMIIALIISLIASKYLAQKLVAPLKKLEDMVEKIGKKQWNDSINIDRNDEIGELSKSIEEMRKELVIQDEYEQTMLQQASHDLKTPLMVIRSYVKAVEDGIYPKGDLESTMRVIDSESERMQKRIKNLLFLTKINYMSKHPGDIGILRIKPLAENIIDNFIYNEKNIKFDIDIKDIEIKGDEEQWTVVFENIIDNELRYAHSIICIKIYEDTEKQYISIYNDGEKISEDKLSDIFSAFNKDKGGNLGLGLDIVKRIINMYHGNIEARNEEAGVSFVITFKKSGV